MRQLAMVICICLLPMAMMAQPQFPTLKLKSTIPTGEGDAFAFGETEGKWALSKSGSAYIYHGSVEQQVLQWGVHSPAMRFGSGDQKLWAHDVCQDIRSREWTVVPRLWDEDGRGEIVSSCFPDGENVLVGFATYRHRKTTAYDPPLARRGLLVIDIQTGKRLHELTADFSWNEYLQLDWHGAWVAAGFGDSLCVWDWKTGRIEFATYILDDGPSPFVDFSDDGKHLVVAGVHSGEITVWETQRWTQTAHFTDQGGRITGARFLPDNRTLVLGNDTLGLSLWDSHSGKRRWSSDPMKVNAIGLHPSGKELYVNIGDATAVYEISFGK